MNRSLSAVTLMSAASPVTSRPDTPFSERGASVISATLAPQISHRLLHMSLAARANHHLGALLGQSLGNRESDTAGCSSHDRTLTLQPLTSMVLRLAQAGHFSSSPLNWDLLRRAA